MTTSSRELFELCKEVYKATGWGQEPDISYLYKYWDNHDELCVISIEKTDDALVPAYTSDYLLEKLPRSVPNDHNGGSYWFDLCFGDSLMWHASYDNAFGDFIHDTHADTPLKALLKLTLKLHEEKTL